MKTTMTTTMTHYNDYNALCTKYKAEDAEKFLKSCVLSWTPWQTSFPLHLVQVVSMDFRLCFLFALQSVLIFSVVFAKLLCVILFANFLYALSSVMVIAYCNVGSLCRLLNALIFARYYNGLV